MIKSQNFFKPVVQLCCRACLLEKYNTMQSSTKKTCAAPLHCGPEKVILFDFFLILFYLVRTRYYFDFLLLSVAEQAGLRLTRSKLQNFDFLPLSITDLVGLWLNGSNPQMVFLNTPCSWAD